jgi:hypothetical protein
MAVALKLKLHVTVAANSKLTLPPPWQLPKQVRLPP